MSRERFITKRFSEASWEIIQAANDILEEYGADDYDLTLRQLYYQFVARQPLDAPFANTTRSYKRLGNIVSDARLAGLIDWSHIVDRTRNLETFSQWGSPEDILASCADSYYEDRWLTQPRYVEVWIEKDALIGVLERACTPWRVPYFSCRGYTSQSELHTAGRRLACHDNVLILHLGDHDPSGIDMTRDITDRVSMFARGRVEVQRIALTMDQIEELNPPPNPTKMTDSRAQDYVHQYGDESWELDALPPDYMTRLINDEIESVLDRERWDNSLAAEEENRDLLTRLHENWTEIAEHIEETYDS